jgi:hypothetical protein
MGEHLCSCGQRFGFHNLRHLLLDAILKQPTRRVRIRTIRNKIENELRN